PAVPIGIGWPAVLSADGQWVAACPSDGPVERLKIIPTGAGEERVVDLGRVACRDLGWLPDNRRILLTGQEAGHARRSYVVDTAGGEPRPLTPERTLCGAPSPDGAAAVCSDSEGHSFIQPIGGGEPRPVS